MNGELHGISPLRHPLRWISYVLTGETDDDVRRFEEDALAARRQIDASAESFENAAAEAFRRGDRRLYDQIAKAAGL